MSLFHASTYFEHHVLIVRRSKSYYTASGIITPIGGRPVHRLRESFLNLCTGTTKSTKRTCGGIGKKKKIYIYIYIN